MEEAAGLALPPASPGYDRYLTEQARRFWSYRRAAFAGKDDIFEPAVEEGTRPPVFRAGHADRNVIVPPNAPEVAAAIGDFLLR